jgi:hypothetical protein
MIVKDLLEQSSEEDIAREFLVLCAENTIESHVTEGRNLLQPCLTLIGRIKAIAPIETGGLLLGGYYTHDGEEQFDTVLFHKAELTAFDPHAAWSGIDTVDALLDGEIERLVQLPVLPETYTYELSPWNEILGYEVNPENISAVGSVTFAAAVLYKMTFFGITEDAVDIERQKLDESLAEAKAIQQLPPEEREKHYYSFEEVFSKFGIRYERTEEEKTQQCREIYREVMENNLRTFRMLTQYRG